MSTVSVTSVLRELFSAPLEAATSAEHDYRRIWRDWLTFKRGLLVDNAGALRPGVNLADIISVAPAVQLDGRIEAAITMRIASATSREGGAQAGLQLGPIHVGGQFSFMSKSAQESTFQASMVFVVSNTNQTLTQLLTTNNLPVTTVAELDQAIAFLKPGK